jgi:hypothetical protein
MARSAPIIHIDVPGVAGPYAVTPPRAEGSVRRTSHIDVVHEGRWDGASRVTGAARDLVTPGTGEPSAWATNIEARVDGAAGIITNLRTQPDEPRVEALVGAGVRFGFRKAAASAMSEAEAEAETTSLLLRLLDDLPLAYMVSGHVMLLKEGLGRWDETTGDDNSVPGGNGKRRLPQADICAGWQTGGHLLSYVEQNGTVAHRVGPEAPPLVSADDALAWHARPPLPVAATRRSRRLDVTPAEDGTARVDSHYRDSYVDLEGIERVLHEYVVEAEVEVASGVILWAQAVPRVLPWTECPQAAESGSRLAGLYLRNLSDVVRNEFTGTTTCTHLNDTMRSLADVTALLELAVSARRARESRDRGQGPEPTRSAAT